MRPDRLTIPALSPLLGLAVSMAPALADCGSAWQASTYCDQEMNASGECGRRLNDCYQSQRRRGNGASRFYGAIAYGMRSTAYGFAYDIPSADAAERRALGHCWKNGDDCRIVARFSNSFAALAAGDGERFAVAKAGTRRQAEAAALTGCTRSGSAGCEIKTWTCALP